MSTEISFYETPVGKWQPQGDYGCIITNPPYGERIGTSEEVEQVIRQLGSIYKRLDTWSAFILSPSKQFEHYFGRPAVKKRKLFNARIECALLQYMGPLAPRRTDEQPLS